LKGHEGEIVSLNFNADGDKVLTGSFDGTAIVIRLLFRFGTLNQEKPFMCSRDIQDKFRVRSLNLGGICVVLPQLIKLVEFGMLEQGSVCQF
jgi:WD40 repeat protein